MTAFLWSIQMPTLSFIRTSSTLTMAAIIPRDLEVTPPEMLALDPWRRFSTYRHASLGS